MENRLPIDREAMRGFIPVARDRAADPIFREQLWSKYIPAHPPVLPHFTVPSRKTRRAGYSFTPRWSKGDPSVPLIAITRLQSERGQKMRGPAVVLVKSKKGFKAQHPSQESFRRLRKARCRFHSRLSLSAPLVIYSLG